MAPHADFLTVEGFEFYHVCPKNVLLKNDAAYMERIEPLSEFPLLFDIEF